MDDEVRALFAKQRYADAGRVLDGILRQSKDNDELWYLRGVVCLKLRSYDSAQEYFGRALFIKKKPGYFRMKAMAHFEIFELEEAIDAFTEALALAPKDAESEFFIAVCYMLMDDPRSDLHLKRARQLDPRRTGALLSNFYAFFIEKDPRVGEAQKKSLLQKIKSLKG
jgi:tetratricopeptide (TPR) repeat protein